MQAVRGILHFLQPGRRGEGGTALSGPGAAGAGAKCSASDASARPEGGASRLAGKVTPASRAALRRAAPRTPRTYASYEPTTGGVPRWGRSVWDFFEITNSAGISAEMPFLVTFFGISA